MLLCIIENCSRLIQLEAKKNDNKKEKNKKKIKKKENLNKQKRIGENEAMQERRREGGQGSIKER